MNEDKNESLSSHSEKTQQMPHIVGTLIEAAINASYFDGTEYQKEHYEHMQQCLGDVMKEYWRVVAMVNSLKGQLEQDEAMLTMAIKKALSIAAYFAAYVDPCDDRHLEGFCEQCDKHYELERMIKEVQKNVQQG